MELENNSYINIDPNIQVISSLKKGRFVIQELEEEINNKTKVNHKKYSFDSKKVIFSYLTYENNKNSSFKKNEENKLENITDKPNNLPSSQDDNHKTDNIIFMDQENNTIKTQNNLEKDEDNYFNENNLKNFEFSTYVLNIEENNYYFLDFELIWEKFIQRNRINLNNNLDKKIFSYPRLPSDKLFMQRNFNSIKITEKKSTNNSTTLQRSLPYTDSRSNLNINKCFQNNSEFKFNQTDSIKYLIPWGYRLDSLKNKTSSGDGINLLGKNKSNSNFLHSQKKPKNSQFQIEKNIKYFYSSKENKILSPKYNIYNNNSDFLHLNRNLNYNFTNELEILKNKEEKKNENLNNKTEKQSNSFEIYNNLNHYSISCSISEEDEEKNKNLNSSKLTKSEAENSEKFLCSEIKLFKNDSNNLLNNNKDNFLINNENNFLKNKNNKNSFINQENLNFENDCDLNDYSAYNILNNNYFKSVNKINKYHANSHKEKDKDSKFFMINENFKNGGSIDNFNHKKNKIKKNSQIFDLEEDDHFYYSCSSINSPVSRQKSRSKFGKKNSNIHFRLNSNKENIKDFKNNNNFDLKKLRASDRSKIGIIKSIQKSFYEDNIVRAENLLKTRINSADRKINKKNKKNCIEKINFELISTIKKDNSSSNESSDYQEELYVIKEISFELMGYNWNKLDVKKLWNECDKKICQLCKKSL